MTRFAWAAAVALGVLIGGCSYMPFHRKPPFQPLSLPPQAAPVPASRNGGIYQPDSAMDWYADHGPWRVGDVVTVDIIENATASNSVQDNVSRSASANGAINQLFGLPLQFGSVNGSPISPSFGGSSTFGSKGGGSATQSDSIVSTISATVIKVLPANNLEILGRTRLDSGTGTEWIRLSGIVRAEDIGPDNTLPSTAIADARVEYSGNGQNYEAARMPWLARFFMSLWPF